MRIIIEVPGQLEAEDVELGDAQGLLVGRTPDPARLGAGRPITTEPVLTRAIAVPSVSTNHLIVWSAGGELHLRDLDSRNGTWVLLPRGQSVRMPGAGEIRVRLGSSGLVVAGDIIPEPTVRGDGPDFSNDIAQAVRDWLARLGMPVQVWTGPPEEERPSALGITSLHLANGERLLVQPEQTVDAEFYGHMVHICRYVSRQNALYAAEEEARGDGMILASAALRSVHRRVVEAALQGLPSMVLLGPSGTGKERLAAAFHRRLGRGGPLVAINCATLTRERLVVDLFGAEKGAYTGALRTMMGAVERADGGTLFLDEVGEMPLDVQPLLLRFLETGEYDRLGAVGEPRFADVRIVAATNRDLRAMVRDRAFREDLFFRLALEIFRVPPLRERFADTVAYLQSQVVDDVSVQEALQPAALEVLRAHSWEGNFRELKNFVRRLPRALGRGSLNVETVRAALEAGALSTVGGADASPALAPGSNDGWMECLNTSMRAFMEDSEQTYPRTWSELTNFVEKYLKPIALAHVANLREARSLDAISVPRVVKQVQADRGTVLKQLHRYFERFVAPR